MHFPVSGGRQRSHDKIHWLKHLSFSQSSAWTGWPLWQMSGMTEIKLTSAPFTFWNKITIHFIAVRGKTSQVWNWSPIWVLRSWQGGLAVLGGVDVMNIYLGRVSPPLPPPSLPTTELIRIINTSVNTKKNSPLTTRNLNSSPFDWRLRIMD